MKKSIFAISSLMLLASCSKKQGDFIGVHDFKIMNAYSVRDTSEMVNSFFGPSSLIIKVEKLIPFTIDIFKSGEELKGTLTITEFQTVKSLKIVDELHLIKSDLKNIHLVNDTLICEIAGKIIPTELKLARSGNDVFLIVQDNEKKKSEKEECNKFATVINSRIIYKALNGASKEPELIKQSNECAADKMVQFCLDNNYKKEKQEYLKQLLNAEPKK